MKPGLSVKVTGHTDRYTLIKTRDPNTAEGTLLY